MLYNTGLAVNGMKTAHPSRLRMLELQESCNILQDQQSFARFSCKINILLQDLARLTVFCKNLARSCKMNILSRLGQVEVPDRKSICPDRNERTRGCRAFKITRPGNTNERTRVWT